MQNRHKTVCKWITLWVFMFLCANWLNANEKHEHSHHVATTKENLSPINQMLQAMHTPMITVEFVKGEDIDVNFISNMIPHHQGAVDSAEILLKHSKNKQLKKIAQNIISTQKAEIEEFRAMLPSLENQGKLYSPKEITLFNKDAESDMQTMHKDMNINIDAVNEDIDRAFMQAMIPHHQGAVNASKQVLQYTQNAAVANIAKRIIEDQEREIAQFEAMLSSPTKTNKKSK